MRGDDPHDISQHDAESEPLLAHAQDGRLSRGSADAPLDVHLSDLPSQRRQSNHHHISWIGSGSPTHALDDPKAGERTNVSAAMKRIASKSHSVRDISRPRRKLTWLSIDHTGRKEHINADKRHLIHKFDLGVPIRDMRLLDLSLVASETGKMLVRDNAIVFSMEYVRCLITADRVFLPRDGFENNHANMKFVQRLEEEIMLAHKEATEERMNADALGEEEGATHYSQSLPFEVVVLEVALNEVCTSITEAAKELEAKTLPALDALLKRVSKTGLEAVRKLKARQQRLTIRTQAVRDELERFLEDDSDLQKFCLTYKKEMEAMAKAERARTLAAPSLTIPDPQNMPPVQFGGLRSAMQGGSPPGWQNPGGHDLLATSMSASIPHLKHSRSIGGVPAGAGYPGGPFAATNMAIFGMEDSMAEATEDVENLLESYYMSIDNAYDKLVSLDEYIKDTEEFIDIDLDWNRNRLIQLDIVLTAAAFAIAPFNLFAGILGENVHIPWFMARDDIGPLPFFVINSFAFLFCFCVFMSIMLYIRAKKLL